MWKIVLNCANRWSNKFFKLWQELFTLNCTTIVPPIVSLTPLTDIKTQCHNNYWRIKITGAVSLKLKAQHNAHYSKQFLQVNSAPASQHKSRNLSDRTHVSRRPCWNTLLLMRLPTFSLVPLIDMYLQRCTDAVSQQSLKISATVLLKLKATKCVFL